MTLGAFLLLITIIEVLLPPNYSVYSHVFSSTRGTQMGVTVTMAEASDNNSTVSSTYVKKAHTAKLFQFAVNASVILMPDNFYQTHT